LDADSQWSLAMREAMEKELNEMRLTLHPG